MLKDENPINIEPENRKSAGELPKDDRLTDSYAEITAKLNFAITALVFDLKGEWGIRSLAEEIRMPRNRLSRIFEAYIDYLKGEEALALLHKFKITSWRLDTLVVIAQKMGIPVSDIILAAEDVLSGLPTWFQYRISRATSQRYKLTCIFYEVMGYRDYGLGDPLKVKGQRKSRKYYQADSFGEDEIEGVDYLIDNVIETELLIPFVNAYKNQEISNKETFELLCKAFEDVIIHDPTAKNMSLPAIVKYDQSILITKISERYKEWFSAKKTPIRHF